MPASINDLKVRAQAFSQRWADACDEAAQAKPFWLDFLEIFGQSNKRLAQFEHQVRRLGERPANVGFVLRSLLREGSSHSDDR